MSEKTDRWGEPVDFPEEMLSGSPTQWWVRCWRYADTVYCRPHGGLCDGFRFSPDTGDVRQLHPAGEVSWEPVEACFGTASH